MYSVVSGPWAVAVLTVLTQHNATVAKSDQVIIRMGGIRYLAELNIFKSELTIVSGGCAMCNVQVRAVLTILNSDFNILNVAIYTNEVILVMTWSDLHRLSTMRVLYTV